MLQVKWYFYRLKGQFQKHNPDRDVDDLSQKETFQAMTFMWSEVSSTAVYLYQHTDMIACSYTVLTTLLNSKHETASRIAKCQMCVAVEQWNSAEVIVPKEPTA